MKYVAPMSRDRIDCNGFKLTDIDVGRKYHHEQTGLNYVITQVMWLGDTDQWCVVHQCSSFMDDTVYCRGAANFFGYHPNGKKRFTPTN